LDYFNDVFNFSGPANFNSLEAYGGVVQLSNLIKKKNLNLCSEDERKSYRVETA